MNSAQIRAAVEPIYNTVFDGLEDRPDSEWDKLFEVKKAGPYRYHEEVSLFGFGLPQEKDEGDSYAEDQGGEAYRTRYLHRVFSLGFSLTKEMIEDGEHISVGSVYSAHLRESMDEGVELFHANIFNLAFSNLQKGGDGSPLLSQSHRLHGFPDGSQVASNTLATPADFSEAALEQIRAQARMCPDERGKLMSIKLRKLIVHPVGLPNATRIVKSEKRAGTNNNDLNFIMESKMLPEGIMELSRLQNEKAWFVQTTAKNGLTHYWKRKLTRGMEEDFKTGSKRYKAEQRYSAYWSNWRCLYGSEGGAQ